MPIDRVMGKFGVDLPSPEEGVVGDPPGVLLSPMSLLCCCVRDIFS